MTQESLSEDDLDRVDRGQCILDRRKLKVQLVLKLNENIVYGCPMTLDNFLTPAVENLRLEVNLRKFRKELREVTKMMMCLMITIKSY